MIIMTKTELIDLLNGDLKNEYMHMHFYLHSAVVVRGLHRAEIREFLLEEAASEMTHVKKFADLIVGLGGIPASLPNPFPTDLTKPVRILKFALDMEETVVANYTARLGHAAELGGVDGKWVELFIEDQLVQSRTDADHIRQLLGGDF